ncbi:hypothetical protein AT239_04020 [Bartonella henselae]|nr:hypothetical protein AT239_04020 [Bartonella henselae]OLL53424.1 hypothetical protein AT240_03050 [Bartonella henselae]
MIEISFFKSCHAYILHGWYIMNDKHIARGEVLPQKAWTSLGLCAPSSTVSTQNHVQLRKTLNNSL